MRMFLVAGVLVSLIIAVPSKAMAQSEGTYGTDVRNRIVQGVVNIFSSLGEVGKGVTDHVGTEVNPVFGTIAGVIDGSIKAVVRAVGGVYDVAVAAIPDAPQFPLEQEPLFDASGSTAKK